MNVTKFFSSNAYLFLPTSKNPKVALAVDNSDLTQNAFKLYNPFSQKAKMLKSVTEMAFTKVNAISKVLVQPKKQDKSDFIEYLEKKLKTPLIASVYFATVHDKVVLQLQTPDSKIIGYVKYPLNDVGIRHLGTEQRALEILSKQGLVQPYLFHDIYDNSPFLLLEALEGEISLVERKYIDGLLKKLVRGTSFPLSEHPRIKALERAVNSLGRPEYAMVLQKLVDRSESSYALVYEHGDFTPWNIVKVGNDYIPFDFEHFIENGFEYFDLIKYYYQVGKLLNNMQGEDLVRFLKKELNIEEIDLLLKLFLIKEIIRSKEENEVCHFEEELFMLLENK